VARRATPAAEPTPVGVTVGATLVDRTVGLATEGETTERTAVEERTAAAQIEVVTETSLIGRGRLNCHAQPFPWVRPCQSAAAKKSADFAVSKVVRHYDDADVDGSR